MANSATDPTELKDDSALPRGQQIAAVTIGTACIAAGVVATFVSDNGAGTATLIAGGLGLVVIAFLGNRIRSLEYGKLKAKFDTAAQLFERAKRLETEGRPDEAQELRSEATRLLADAAPSARMYEQIRESAPSGPARTANLYRALREALPTLRAQHPDAASIRAVFDKGGEGDRVLAMVLMQEDPSAADFDAILDVIAHSRTEFEQYEALRAAEGILPRLDAESSSALERALARQTSRGGWIEPTKDTWAPAQRMLQKLRSGNREPETSGDSG